MPGPKKKKSIKKPASARNTTRLKEPHHINCPVVGIGASAGGLAAFKTFFSHMPDSSGIAFILVPHLDPDHQSLMVELLTRQTEMPVCEVKHNMVVEPNHVYIIPPGKYLAINNNRLQLSAPPQPHIIDTAIDHFLRSLAADQQERSIGIVLSGTSSHGTLGLQTIKASGGMTMVQQPDTAEYPAMPQNAIDAGIVDVSLPAEKMPEALIKYVQHAYLSGAWEPTEPAKTEFEQLDRVLGLLRARTKYDFRYYRKNMIMRRVQRRMSLHHIEQLSDYRQLLHDNLDEAKQLYRDMLISVTSFFREPEAYLLLEQRVIAQWLERKKSDRPIRLWIAGCATGEEAYSMAILLIEKFAQAQKPLNLQIFATDIDETALEIARQGCYPVSIADDISAERLARFFTLSGSHYQINKQVREQVVFAAQNLITDAPFSKLDLISCRNLLIYLEPELQRKVISLFHFALSEDGHLFLGSSETVGRNIDLFETVSKKWRIFRRIGPTRRDMVEFPITAGYQRRGVLPMALQTSATHEVDFAELTRRQLLKDYAPASVLINRKYEVLYFQGATGDFLEAPSGEPTRDLLAMARQGLQTKLRAACHKAIRNVETVTDTSPRIKRDGKWHHCSISVKPINEPKQAEGLLLVTFQQLETTEVATAGIETKSVAVEESTLVRELEYELKATRDDLQSTIEDMESSNEELKASNEEIMSMNEELQSANEELETSKEELQSLNEELSTVNNQLQDKVEELDKANNDMANLLNSADIATLFLDIHLCIRQFTPFTGKLLGLINNDTGRPISTFATDFTGADLLHDAHQVLDKLAPLENVFSTSDGCHYIRRTQPYRTTDNRIGGLVVSFIDITQRIASEQLSKRMATVLHDSNDAITVLTLTGDITAWNHGAEKMYGYHEAKALKMNICDMVPTDKQTETQAILKRIADGELLQSFDSSRRCKDGRTLEVWVTVTPLYDESGQLSAIATTERDLSERLQRDVLQQQTSFLLDMVEHLPVGAIYIEHNQLMMNRAAEQLTGYQREELATLDQWFSKLYGERADEIQQLYQRDRDSGFPNATAPITINQKSGKMRHVEYAAYRFDHHEVWIIHDVTQRELIEITLREREERLRTVMDHVAEAIVVINHEGMITDFNIAAHNLFGYNTDEIIGQNVKQLMPSPHREAHDTYLKHYAKTGKSRILNQPRELPGCHKDGSTFPLLITITEIEHAGIFVGIMHNLSAQRALERQIADISTQERERVGLEIHDGLGQQLTGLSMLTTNLRNKLAAHNMPETQQVDELLKQLKLAIEDTRALSRGLSPVPVTPEGLSDALTLLAHDVKHRTGIDCHFKAANNIRINNRTDAMQIYRIAQEAVNNAIKHAKASLINIDLNADENHCEVTVSDNGHGFNPDVSAKDGIGIRIMHYRANIIGCNLDIESSAKKGTVVRCKRTASYSQL